MTKIHSGCFSRVHPSCHASQHECQYQAFDTVSFRRHDVYLHNIFADWPDRMDLQKCTNSITWELHANLILSNWENLKSSKLSSSNYYENLLGGKCSALLHSNCWFRERITRGSAMPRRSWWCTIMSTVIHLHTAIKNRELSDIFVDGFLKRNKK